MFPKALYCSSGNVLVFVLSLGNVLLFSAPYFFQSSGEETTRIQVLKVLTGLELRLEPRWFFSSCIQ